MFTAVSNPCGFQTDVFAVKKRSLKKRSSLLGIARKEQKTDLFAAEPSKRRKPAFLSPRGPVLLKLASKPTPDYTPPMLTPTPVLPASAPVLPIIDTEPDEEPHVIHASFYGSSLLSMSIFQCRDCRAFNGMQEVTYDEQGSALFSVKLCSKCQSCNRIMRKAYWNSMKC